MSLLDRHRVRALIIKESWQILRDPSTFLIAFVLPLILLFLFGYAVNLDTARTRIGLALLDSGDAALSLTSAFRASPYFDVTVSPSVAPLERALVRGSVRGVVVVPEDFGRTVASGGGTIQVITDGSQPNTASFVASYAEGVRAAWAAGRATERGASSAPPVTLNARYWFNPELASRYFLVPGSMAIVLTMIGTLLTALVIAREWERGTLEAARATPMTTVEFMASKVLPYFALGLGSALVCALLAVTLFGVPFRGSVLALGAIVATFMIPALGQGLLISAATRNQFVASQIALLTAFLPALQLSGFIFEQSSMPRWIQALSYLVPARYLIPMLQTVFLAGDLWGLFLRNMAVLLAFGAVFFLLTWRVSRRAIA